MSLKLTSSVVGAVCLAVLLSAPGFAQDQGSSGSTTQPTPAVSEGDRDALVELIKQRVLAAQKENAEKAKQNPAATQPAAASQPSVIAAPGYTPPAPAQPAAGQSCCGGTSKLDLNPPPAGSPQPKLVATTKATNDNVWVGQPATFKFEVSNEGEAPLNLFLKPSCGPKWNGLADRVLKPGQKETLEAVVPAPPRGQQLKVNLFVQSNDSQNRNVTFECSGPVRTAMTLEPAMVMFGQIKRDSLGETRVIKIKRANAGALKPKIRSVMNNAIHAEIRELRAGEEYELQVDLKPPWPNQPFYGNIVLESGVEQSPQDTIVVSAAIAPRIQAIPNNFAYLPRSKDQEHEANVRLVWSGAPGKILNVAVTDPKLQVRLAEENGEPKLYLHFPANYAPPATAAPVVQVTTDDPIAKLFAIPIQTFARPVANQPPVAGPNIVTPAAKLTKGAAPGAATQPQATNQPAPTSAPGAGKSVGAAKPAQANPAPNQPAQPTAAQPGSGATGAAGSPNK